MHRLGISVYPEKSTQKEVRDFDSCRASDFKKR